MAAGNVKVYGAAAEAIMKGNLDLDLPVRVVLLRAGYTPNQGVHAVFSDISGFEVAAGGGYATHGVALANAAVSRTGNAIKYDGDDVSWANSTITAKYAALVQDADASGGLVAGDPLLAFVDLNEGGAALSSSNGPFSVAWHATLGVFTLTAQ